MIDSFAMKNLDGQLSYLKAYEKELKDPITAYMSPKIRKTKEIQPFSQK